MSDVTARSLLATSDLHVSHRGNPEIVERIRPRTDGDWLIVAGDISHTIDGIDWTLGLLADRFERVIWTPGNHDLWSVRDTDLRGEARYEQLVALCRRLGVVSPEDPYPVWETDDEAFVIAPLFLLYDYSFRPPGMSLPEAMEHAYRTGVVCTDEKVLYPDPHPSIAEWCRQRVAATRPRLEAIPADHRTVLVSHYPLHRGPTTMLRWPHFSMWCGTDLTADWHVQFRAAAVVYGHLHIPLTFTFDGVRFDEVSLGYPREWRRRDAGGPDPVRPILPADATREPANHLLAE